MKYEENACNRDRRVVSKTQERQLTEHELDLISGAGGESCLFVYSGGSGTTVITAEGSGR